MSKPSIDGFNWQQFGMHPSDSARLADCFGIELELEGSLFYGPSPGNYWRATEDHSLRGGLEYVIHSPTKMANLDEATQDLKKLLELCKSPETSIRCSTHVHISVADLTVRQIYNAIAAYYLLEEVLVSTQPRQRNGNLFCLKMDNARGIAEGIFTSLETGRFFGYFQPISMWKYGALNLATPKRYQSLEFRFLSAILDPDVLNKWVRLFHNLIHNTKHLSPTVLLQKYDFMDTFEFIDFVLGEGSSKFLGLIDGPSKGSSKDRVNRLMYVNYDFVNTLTKYLNNPKFQMPKEFWNPDLTPPNLSAEIASIQNQWDALIHTPTFSQDIWNVDVDEGDFTSSENEL